LEHEPVLLAEVLAFLDALGPGAVLLDATVGLGGHAGALLEAVPGLRVVGTDRDGEMLAVARERLSGFGARAELHRSPFAELGAVCDAAGIDRLDAALFDVGVSSPQLDVAERGFSFRHDGPLDMRMDRSQGETAADLIARLPETDLGNLVYELGEERASRRVARAIVAERRREPIRTTARLASIVRRAVGRRGRIDAATRTFQALRMAVNDELGQLRAGLDAAAGRLRPGGRLIAISFHSGEDRIVKNALRADDRLRVLTKKVVRAGRRETAANPRARSARLRAAERRASDA
jgi:16S rRNA (cytosine1402-N4)-methyltransferase